MKISPDNHTVRYKVYYMRLDLGLGAKGTSIVKNNVNTNEGILRLDVT